MSENTSLQQQNEILLLSYSARSSSDGSLDITHSHDAIRKHLSGLKAISIANNDFISLHSGKRVLFNDEMKSGIIYVSFVYISTTFPAPANSFPVLSVTVRLTARNGVGPGGAEYC